MVHNVLENVAITEMVMKVVRKGDFELTVMFYPPNTTAILQACDQSVFGWIKGEWRNSELLELWNAADGDERYTKF